MEAVTKVQIASKYGQRVRCPKTADPSITKCLPQLTRHALSLQNENPTFCNTLQPMHSNLFSSSKLSKLYLAKIAIFWEGSLQAVPAFQSSIPHPPSPIPQKLSTANFSPLVDKLFIKYSDRLREVLYLCET